jgi:radical SAM protein with 4Fe4S-binding SPASM domain
MGEPTLNPMLPDLIAYASHTVKTEFSTNATQLNPTMSQLLIEAGLSTIWFALDADTQATYNKIRIGGSFSKVMRNIRDFLAIKARLRSQIEVIVQMVVMPDNQHEQQRFIDYWSHVKGVTYVSTKFLDSFAGSINNDLVKAPRLDRFPCPELFNRVVILSNGDVAPCCRDWSGAYSYGNVNDQSVEWIWKNSPALAELRAEHLSGKYLSEPCKACKEWHIPMDRHVANAETSEDFKGIPLVPTGG